MLTDRIKDGLERFVRSSLPRVDYLAFYRAKVVSQSADKKKLDVKPDDARIPGTTAELMLGIPAAKVSVNPGAFVLLGWKGGDPRLPIALLWEDGASITGFEIGSSADNVVTKKDLGTFLQLWQSAAVGGPDGGALMRSNTIAALQLVGWPVGPPDPICGSNVVKVQRI